MLLTSGCTHRSADEEAPEEFGVASALDLADLDLVEGLDRPHTEEARLGVPRSQNMSLDDRVTATKCDRKRRSLEECVVVDAVGDGREPHVVEERIARARRRIR